MVPDGTVGDEAELGALKYPFKPHPEREYLLKGLI